MTENKKTMTRLDLKLKDAIENDSSIPTDYKCISITTLSDKIGFLYNFYKEESNKD